MAIKVFWAIILAVATYALWYRVTVATWCPAMWFGTAPPFIIAIGFVGFYRLLGRLGIGDTD